MVPQRVGGNQGNVPAPLAQRRLVQFDHPQPMVKILAEATFGHRCGKVDMGGREDAHVYAHLAVATEAFEAALLQEAQQRSLRIHRPVADLRSEEHTSELKSLMRNPYAVFCLTKEQKKTNTKHR